MTLQNFVVLCSLVVCLFFVERKQPFLLRHIFILYTFAIYNIAPLFLADDPDERLAWSVEFVGVCSVFLTGYYSVLLLIRRRARRGFHFPTEAISEKRILKPGIILLMASNALLFMYNLYTYGVIEFFNGSMLMDIFQQYGQANTTGAILQMLAFILGTATTVFVVVLVEQRVRSRESASNARSVSRNRAVLQLSFVWLVAFPAFQLARAAVVSGSVMYLLIRSRLVKRGMSAGLVIVGSIALAVFIYVGVSRAKLMGRNIGVESLFISELTPWLAYRDIKNNIGALGYQHGTTIVWPLLLKVIPRGLFPDKFHNTSGFYMSELHPNTFAAGFVIPPTFMGDLYLNFSLPGLLLGSLLLGCATAAIDNILLSRSNRFGLFVVCLASYVELLRDSLANSLFYVLVPVGFYFVLRSWAASVGRGEGLKTLGVRQKEFGPRPPRTSMRAAGP